MISVGRGDGGLGLGLGFGGGGDRRKMKIDESKLEEGEAYDGANFDPDVDLAYIDDKIQNVLGHLRKDFEGGVLSAENLGAKYGVYGSFLPSYQRPSTLPPINTPQKVPINSTPKSPHNLPPEGLRLNTVVPLSKTFSMKFAPPTSAVPSLAVENFPKKDLHVHSHKTITPESEPVIKSVSPSHKKILKVRLKVGPDSILSQKAAAIYSGLGLSSPSSSVDSPARSIELSAESWGAPYASPARILEMMMSFPVPGANLLSPLSDSLLCLTEREEIGNGLKGVQECSTLLVDKTSSLRGDVGLSREKKIKLPDRRKMEVINDMAKDAGNDTRMEINSSTLEGASLEPITCRNVNMVEYRHSETSSANGVRNERKFSPHSEIRADPIKCERFTRDTIRDTCKPELNELKGRKDLSGGSTNPSVLKLSQSATSLKQHGAEKSQRKEQLPSDGNKKSKGRQNSITLSAELPAGTVGLDSSAPPKDKKNKINDCPSKFKLDDNRSLPKESININKYRREVRGHMDKAENRFDSCKTPFDGPKHLELDVTEKETYTSSKAKKRLGGKKLDDLSTFEADKKVASFVSLSLPEKVPDSDVPPTIDAQDAWVCCDLCEKWRLLPLGMDPAQLPAKWLCSMLNWLPGMNRCDIGEDITTNAVQPFYQIPVAESRSDMHSYPDGLSSEETFSNVLHLEQTHQDRTLHSVEKKNLVLKETCDTDNQSFTRKSQQTSSKGKSLIGANQSPSGCKIVIKADSQYLSNSSDISIETNKHKKLRGGDAKYLKSGRKRTADEEGFEGSKKFKTEGLYHRDEHRGALECDPKDSIQSFVKKPKDQIQVSFDGEAQSISKSDMMVIAAKKRKVREGQESGTFQSETLPSTRHLQEKGFSVKEDKSESDTSKGKQSRVSKSDFKDSNTNLADEKRVKKGKVPRVIICGSNTAHRSVTPPSGLGNTELEYGRTEAIVERVREHHYSSNGSLTRNSQKCPHSEDERRSLRHHCSAIRGKDEKTNTQQESDEEKQKRLPLSLGKTCKGKESPVLPVNESVKFDAKCLKIPKQSRKATDQNVFVAKGVVTPSPVRKDSSSKVVSNVMKEAKDLKHKADRLKNSGLELDSTGLYFEAALKFLHAASLLEVLNDGTKAGEITHSMHVYKDTAKLCEFVVHEYERHKDMLSAALAYKCKEVAYMRIIYSKQSSICKDQHDLQTELQMGPPLGESPSSSASELDNFNNRGTRDKITLDKGISSSENARNHVIVARNVPSFGRLVNLAQDVTSAMDASKKSQYAFAAANVVGQEESQQAKIISAVKRVVDFNFHDVEGLLRLVRLAVEAIHS
ncbi:hypothetical protein GIB67_009954 [Kingdonia uniflora]|uniref:CW-type domain-containing protein n=1 Tax=Kingdonia uniflora TaxID=39325 RepID=A0A7J7L8Z2_9MAGN|nr:hypothetical protein GIB67_009954 [Kingdonia uniflora]